MGAAKEVDAEFGLVESGIQNSQVYCQLGCCIGGGFWIVDLALVLMGGYCRCAVD